MPTVSQSRPAFLPQSDEIHQRSQRRRNEGGKFAGVIAVDAYQEMIIVNYERVKGELPRDGGSWVIVFRPGDVLAVVKTASGIQP